MHVETIAKAALENGLRVTVCQLPHARTLRAGVFVDHGVKDEREEDNGIAHFLEHLTFNGHSRDGETGRMLGELIDQGALFEAYTGKEATRAVLTAQRKHAGKMIETMGRMLTDCRIGADRIEHERTIILQELEQYFASARVKEELIEQAMWGNRSLGLFVIGNPRTVAAFTEDQLQDRHRAYYAPRNTHLVLYGDIAADEALHHLEGSSFWHWRNSEPRRRQVPLLGGEPTLLGLGNAPRVDMTIGFLAPKFHERERFAAVLLADVLGKGVKSRLFTELREKRELAYLVNAYTMHYIAGGYLAVNVNCRRERLPDVYGVVQEILQDMRLRGVDEEELARAKAWRITNLMQLPNNAAKHLQILGRYAMRDRDFFVDVEADEYQEVTARDLQELAEMLFAEERMGIAALGAPAGELHELLEIRQA